MVFIFAAKVYLLKIETKLLFTESAILEAKETQDHDLGNKVTAIKHYIRICFAQLNSETAAYKLQ